MRTLVIYINITIFPLFMMSYRSKQTKITYLIFTKQRFFFRSLNNLSIPL